MKKDFRIVYLGTPDFAVLPLKSIVENGYNVVGVVCNQDKPFGRKQILTAPPVKKFANSVNIPIFQYKKIREEGVFDLKKFAPDIMITCAFGQILSQEILDIPKLGVFNIHASLLPKYRGASPIQTAILNGETKTGITIMKTDIGVDTGDIVLQEEFNIPNEMTAGELFENLSLLGSKCILKALDKIVEGNESYIKQDNSLATFTKIFKKEDAKINWNDNANKIVNSVRAFNPSPIAYTLYNGEPLKIFKAKISELKGNQGEVLKSDSELIVGCKDYSVSILTLQKAGGKAMNVKEFLMGNKISIGTVFNK